MGECFLEAGLYHDSIQTLTELIQKDPENKEAYFNRAQAYFELGDFDLALSDYFQSKKELNKLDPKENGWKEYVDFYQGFLEGQTEGFKEGIVEFFPSLFDSAMALSNGLWAAVTSPDKVCKNVKDSAVNCVDYLKELEAKELLENTETEIKILLSAWRDLSSLDQGKWIGKIVGKFGVIVESVQNLTFYQRENPAIDRS